MCPLASIISAQMSAGSSVKFISVPLKTNILLSLSFVSSKSVALKPSLSFF